MTDLLLINRGKELYQKLSKRDYSGSETDNYAQLLQTIFYHLTTSKQVDDFFGLLANAERDNKSIKIKYSSINNDEYFLSDLILI